MAKNESIEAPGHFGEEGRNLWEALTAQYDFLSDAAGLKLLRVACESFERAQECRAKIDEQGLTILDRFGQMRPHPLLAAERDSRAQFLQAMKSLNLETEAQAPKTLGRPTSYDRHAKGKGW